MLPVGHIRSSTHRILSLILTAAASLAFDALPPQSLDSRCELWGELETGRVACRYIDTHTQTNASTSHTFFFLTADWQLWPTCITVEGKKKKLLLELKALTESNLSAKRVFKHKWQSVRAVLLLCLKSSKQDGRVGDRNPLRKEEEDDLSSAFTQQCQASEQIL